MSVDVQEILVRKQIIIEAPRAHVFAIFGEHHDLWWPRKNHIGNSERFTAVLEPKIGGRWYERSDNGTECDWGRVLEWDVPERILLSWNINAEWRYDPALQTEVEIRFTAESDERTLVELEHRRLERYGDKAQMMRAIFDSPDGWSGALEALAIHSLRNDVVP